VKGLEYLKVLYYDIVKENIYKKKKKNFLKSLDLLGVTNLDYNKLDVLKVGRTTGQITSGVGKLTSKTVSGVSKTTGKVMGDVTKTTGKVMGDVTKTTGKVFDSVNIFKKKDKKEEKEEKVEKEEEKEVKEQVKEEKKKSFTFLGSKKKDEKEEEKKKKEEEDKKKEEEEKKKEMEKKKEEEKLKDEARTIIKSQEVIEQEYMDIDILDAKLCFQNIEQIYFIHKVFVSALGKIILLKNNRKVINYI
jgi:hypothetical protein